MVDFPIKTSIYKGFSMAMLNNQMVFFHNPWKTPRMKHDSPAIPSRSSKESKRSEGTTQARGLSRIFGG